MDESKNIRLSVASIDYRFKFTTYIFLLVGLPVSSVVLYYSLRKVDFSKPGLDLIVIIGVILLGLIVVYFILAHMFYKLDVTLFGNELHIVEGIMRPRNQQIALSDIEAVELDGDHIRILFKNGGLIQFGRWLESDSERKNIIKKIEMCRDLFGKWTAEELASTVEILRDEYGFDV